ncbi:acyl carrier protein [Azospirillum formosense]|uniref:acyl carrier protein n=1 Tax=Azospirillum formosense TaxID=861533 RepID=UPI001FEC1A7B|nr:acyl carrier protein [Azospirillum formosense]
MDAAVLRKRHFHAMNLQRMRVILRAKVAVHKGRGMSEPILGITNWMHLFRWIVKLIRDEYGVDEKVLTRNAVLDGGIGLTAEQLEQVLDHIAETFELTFPENTLNETVRLEDLCTLTAWMRGLFKKPDFVTPPFEERCRSLNNVPA